jgi:hypothetical protein
VNEKRLRFVLKSTAGVDVFERFFPGGKTILNRTEWRGKEPRSCGVTGFKSRTHRADDPSPVTYEIEVSYRPKGVITYVGNTKYDGWTAMMLDRQRDGTLLDGKGQPLADGLPPVYMPFEIHKDVEFNDLDFGEFVGEFDAPGVRHTTRDAIMEEMKEGGSFGGGTRSTFMAPRRSRPNRKIILTNQPSGPAGDKWGSDIINVSNDTPHVEQVLMDRLAELMADYLEGRCYIKSLSNGEMTYVELADSLVDCSPNELGEDSWFDVLTSFTPAGFLEELAKRLMATYEVDVSVVDGRPGGLLLRRPAKPA